MNARGRTQFAPTEKDRECEISLSFFYTSCLQGIVCYTFQVNGRAVMSLPLHKGAFGLCVQKVRLPFLTSTAFADTKAKPLARRGKKS